MTFESLEGVDGVLDINIPMLLQANGDWDGVTVYRSPLVRDDDPVFQPVVDWISEHDLKPEKFDIHDAPAMYSVRRV